MHYTKVRQLNDGGEGYIFELKEAPDMLLKVYKERDAAGEPIVTPELISKLTYMSQHPPASLVSQGSIAWPAKLVFENGSFAGFLMPRLNFDAHIQSVYSYKHPVIDKAEYAEYPSVKSRVSVAVNLCSALHELHSLGYVVGDFNHENIGINYSTGQVYFVDCDSFHITGADGGIFRTNVIMGGYLAPEIIAHCNDERAAGREYKLDKVALPTFTRESDPFRGVYATAAGSTASPFLGNDAIERDSYVFKAGNRPSAVFCPPDNSLPPYILALFNKAFIDGRAAPGARPDAGTWYSSLKYYLTELKACADNGKHFYWEELTSCPYCAADERLYAMQFGTAPHPSPAPEPVIQPVIPPLQPKKRTKRDAAEIFAACLAILVFLGLMVLFAFAAGRRRLADTDRNDAVSRPADTTPDDAVSNSYSWRWSDEPSYIGGVPTSVMMFDYPTYGSGFRLGLKLADYDDAGKWWDVYIYDYDVAGFVCVDSIQLTEAGVWTYADITFSERYVYSILIRPPTDEYGNWNEYSLFADVEQIRR